MPRDFSRASRIADQLQRDLSELIRLEAAAGERHRGWAETVVASGRRLLSMVEAMIDRASLESTSALTMAELDYFWIANAIYLAFVLSALLGSMAKLMAYRHGFQPW